MHKTKYDLIVIGGGILGTFHAYHALRLNLKVALIEKNNEPISASVRNFGQVVPSGMNKKWQTLGRRSVEIYKTLQSQFDISVRANGSIYLASNDEEQQLLHELNSINQSNRYPSEMKSAKQCLAAYDGLRSNYVKEGLFFPEEVTVEPRVAIHKIRSYLIEQMGLSYFPNQTIIDIKTASDAVQAICNTGQTFEAAKAAVCTGSDFKNLYPDLFAKSDLQVTKLQMMQTVPQMGQSIPGAVLTGLSIRRYESFAECPSFRSIKASEPLDSNERKWSIHVLFKQAFDGSVIIGDSHEYRNAAFSDQLGFDMNQEINEYMIKLAKEIFDLSAWEIQRSWIGTYSQSKNSDLFETTIDDNVHVVTGIGGKGMTGSPALAEVRINDMFKTSGMLI